MVVVVEADILISSQAERRVEDMCLGVDAAQRACQGAAVNWVKCPGERLPSPDALPGVAVSQLPSLRLPLVFQARTVEHNVIANSHGSNNNGSSAPRVGKVVITLATAATPQRVEAGSSAVSRQCLPRVTDAPCRTPSTATKPEPYNAAQAGKVGHGLLGRHGWQRSPKGDSGAREPSTEPSVSDKPKPNLEQTGLITSTRTRF